MNPVRSRFRHLHVVSGLSYPLARLPLRLTVTLCGVFCYFIWQRIEGEFRKVLSKGLKVNAGKSKMMVGSSGGKMIVNSGKWSCGVCGRVQTLFSAKYVNMDSQTVQWCAW